MTTKVAVKRVLKIPAMQEANRRAWSELSVLGRVVGGKAPVTDTATRAASSKRAKKK